MEKLGLKNKHVSNYTGIDKCTVSTLLSGDKELTKWHKVAMYYKESSQKTPKSLA